MSWKASGRLIVVLVLYPLMATTVALDALWIAAYGRYGPPALYTVAVLVIAGAVSTGRRWLLSLPSTGCIAVGAVAVSLANVAMVVAAGEISSARQYAGGAAAVALAINGPTLALTALACRLGEIVIGSGDARLVRRPQAADSRPTLIDPLLAEQALAELVRAADVDTDLRSAIRPAATATASAPTAALPTVPMQPVEQATLIDLDEVLAA